MLSPAASRNDSAAGYFICSRGKPEIQALCLGGVADLSTPPNRICGSGCLLPPRRRVIRHHSWTTRQQSFPAAVTVKGWGHHRYIAALRP